MDVVQLARPQLISSINDAAPKSPRKQPHTLQEATGCSKANAVGRRPQMVGQGLWKRVSRVAAWLRWITGNLGELDALAVLEVAIPFPPAYASCVAIATDGLTNARTYA